MMPHKYTKEEAEFIRENIKGRLLKDLLILFNERFGQSLTYAQMKRYASYNGLRNGINCCFNKGHVPANKGKKGFCPEGSKKTQFKKGHIPKNHREVGSERKTRDDYIEVKVAEPNKWKLKQLIIWELTNGPIPPNHCILFADQNKQNFDLDNLVLVSRQHMAVMNHLGLIFPDKDLTKSGKTIADIRMQISKRTNKSSKVRK